MAGAHPTDGRRKKSKEGNFRTMERQEGGRYADGRAQDDIVEGANEVRQRQRMVACVSARHEAV